MAILARVYLVRHGETDANRNGIIQGQMNTALNSLGLRQANLVGEALQSLSFDIAFSSDLSRASKTAEAILKHHPDVHLQTQNDLRERYMGYIQGKPVKEGEKLLGLADNTIESRADFAARAVSWWNRKIVEGTASLSLRNDPYHILVTTHGGFISTLVKALIRSQNVKCAPGVVIWRCVNSSVTIIEIEEGKEGCVVQYGDASHLKGNIQKDAVESNADEVQVAE